MGFVRFFRENIRWLMAGFLMAMMSSLGQTYFISIFAGNIRATFDLGHGEWGAIYAAGTMASGMLMIFAGGLADRFRARALGAVLIGGLALACLAMATVNKAFLLIPIIFALRFTGQGMLSHLSMVSIARWFVANRGKALAFAGLGYALGEGVLPIVVVSLLKFYHWQWMWGICAIVALLLIPVLWRLLAKERTPQSMAENDQAKGMAAKHWTRLDVLKHWSFWMLLPAITMQSAFITSFFFLQVHFAEVKGWSHLELVTLFPMFSISGIVFTLIAGWAIDRFGAVRLMVFVQPALIVGFLIAMVGFDYVTLALAIILMGASSGANSTIFSAVWPELYGTKNLGGIKAIATASMVLGSGFGPGITGYFIDKGYDFPSQLGVISIAVALGWLSVFFCSRWAQRDLALSA